jgi:hypothetical protein
MGRSKRNFIIIAALLVIALAIAIASVPYRARRAVERYQAQLLASGEKLNPEQLWPIPPPLESNGAPLFRQVMMLNWSGLTNILDKNAPVAMRMIAPGKAAVGWAQPNVHSNIDTNTWEEIEAALSRFDSYLDDVRLAAQRPVFDFGLDYRQGWSLLLPHLAPLKRSVQFLTYDSVCDLHRGDVMAACTNVETTLALVRATSTEPIPISQLVRLAMAQIAMTATWELLQSTNLTEAQLAAIQHDWAGLDFIEPSEQSLEFERACSQMIITRMRNSSAQFRQVISLGSGGSASGTPLPIQVGERFLSEMVIATRETRWRFSQSYPDQLKALKGLQALLQTFRQVETNHSFVDAIRRQQGALDKLGLQPPEDDNFNWLDANGPDLSSLFSRSVLSLGRVCERVFNAEVARDLTTTALALKRYQLAHSDYPSDLSSLVPRFLPAIPRDPADGQPLRYRVKPDGTFLLYSIGLDGVDNGGDPSPVDGKTKSFSWLRGRDLVWPSPGTPEGLAQTHRAGAEDQPDRPL